MLSLQITLVAKPALRRRQWQRWLIWGVPTLLLLPVAVIVSRPYVAALRYAPQEGDIVFQSLPHNPLVNAIEGATGSPYSHCGLVAQEDGRWVVYEAFRGVERTPLSAWLSRGRDGGFAVYRLRKDQRRHIPATIAAAKRMLGRQYDQRYCWDDEKIYCSELVFKAYKQASGEPLGQLIRLGDLRWQPYRATIERIEVGPVPVDRMMLAPRDLAKAPQLEQVYRFGL